MKRDNDRKTEIILSVLGVIPVVWLALLIAPAVDGGLPTMNNIRNRAAEVVYNDLIYN